MIDPLRQTAGAVAVTVALLAQGTAGAQTSCESLPNPIIVAGSNDLVPFVQRFAVSLSKESPPATIITVIGQSTSCAAVAGLVSGTDIGGMSGRYYTMTDTTVATNVCLFMSSRTVDVAISDVFYESCANVTQPKPDDMADVLGPVQPTLLVVPSLNASTQYLTYAEARAIFGCGVSSTRTVAGVFADPTHVFCRNPEVGTQITVAKNIGVPESMLAPPRCIAANTESTQLTSLLGDVALGVSPAVDMIAFMSARGVEPQRGQHLLPLAFQTLGQTQAYYADSSPFLADRQNVRDGHYRLWSYTHMITKTVGGTMSAPASVLIGWINGTKTSPNFDHVALDVAVGAIPLCAMKVKRAADGGSLSAYAPAQTCNCSFEALSSRTLPAGCTPCTSPTSCGCGSTCRRGFCE